MARYIDLDKAIERLNVSPAFRNMGDGYFLLGVVEKLLKNLPTADVVPKSEEGAECPTCHGTGRIGTTDWLTKNISKKQLAEEKAKVIAEYEQHIKNEFAREIFKELDQELAYCLESHPYAISRYCEIRRKYTKRNET